MTVAEHGADFDGELFAAITTLEELAVGELVGFEAAAVRAIAVSAVFAPALGFQESQT